MIHTDAKGWIAECTELRPVLPRTAIGGGMATCLCDGSLRLVMSLMFQTVYAAPFGFKQTVEELLIACIHDNRQVCGKVHVLVYFQQIMQSYS